MNEDENQPDQINPEPHLIPEVSAPAPEFPATAEISQNESELTPPPAPISVHQRIAANKRTSFILTLIFIPIILIIVIATALTILDKVSDNDEETVSDDSAMIAERDAQRKDDIAYTFSQINSYQTNNRGSVPSGPFNTLPGQPASAADSAFLDAYLLRDRGEFSDPQTDKEYGFITDSTSAAATTDTFAYSGPGYSCGDNGFIESQSIRIVAISIKLESGELYCQDNS